MGLDPLIPLGWEGFGFLGYCFSIGLVMSPCLFSKKPKAPMDAKVCQRSLAKLNCPSETAPDGFQWRWHFAGSGGDTVIHRWKPPPRLTPKKTGRFFFVVFVGFNVTRLWMIIRLIRHDLIVKVTVMMINWNSWGGCFFLPIYRTTKCHCFPRKTSLLR